MRFVEHLDNFTSYLLIFLQHLLRVHTPLSAGGLAESEWYIWIFCYQGTNIANKLPNGLS